jgi:hypothetical protein
MDRGLWALETLWRVSGREMRNGELRDADWVGQAIVQQRIAAPSGESFNGELGPVDTRSLRMAAHIPLRRDRRCRRGRSAGMLH